MQRSWLITMVMAQGLLAQAPPVDPRPAPTPVQAPESKPFDQLRPTQRKLAYTLYRAALSAHELGYYRGHAKTLEVRDALDALLEARLYLPEKAQTPLPAVEAYLTKLRANHGLYDAEGRKVLLETTWKDLQAAARAAAKAGPKGLEARLTPLKGLLLDPKLDAAAPGWAEPQGERKKAGAAKGPRAPEGFAEQKAVTALWVRRAQAWIENSPQVVEVKGEKKTRRMPDPVQTKALKDLLAWLEKDDLELLRDPGFAWLDLRRLGAAPGAGLLAKAEAICGSKAPEGAAAPLPLLPTYEPVVGDSKFAKGEEKQSVLVEVKLGAPATTLSGQMSVFERLGRSQDLGVK